MFNLPCVLQCSCVEGTIVAVIENLLSTHLPFQELMVHLIVYCVSDEMAQSTHWDEESADCTITGKGQCLTWLSSWGVSWAVHLTVPRGAWWLQSCKKGDHQTRVQMKTHNQMDSGLSLKLLQDEWWYFRRSRDTLWWKMLHCSGKKVNKATVRRVTAAAACVTCINLLEEKEGEERLCGQCSEMNRHRIAFCRQKWSCIDCSQRKSRILWK